jgi:plastocyanin
MSQVVAGILAAVLGAPPALPGHVVDVVAGDYYFEAPDTIPAGLTTFRLQSREGGHGAWIVRLARGHTVNELVAAGDVGRRTPWATNLGGPAFPAPHGSANATMVLAPGEYAIVCFVRGADDTPHARLGMFHRLVVVPTRRAPEPLPHPDATITLVDYAFRVPPSLGAGRHVVRVVNAGNVNHELRIQRVLPGHTAEESLAWTPSSKAPPPDEDFATMATLPPGGAVTTTLDLAPGAYTLFCVPQLKHGMKGVLRVLPAGR